MPKELTVVAGTPRPLHKAPKTNAPANHQANKSSKTGTVIHPVPRTALSYPVDAREKEKVTIELDSDVLEHLRSIGSDWQEEVNNLLRKTMI